MRNSDELEMHHSYVCESAEMDGDASNNVFVKDASSDKSLLDDSGVETMDVHVDIISYVDDHGDNLEEEDVKCVILASQIEVLGVGKVVEDDALVDESSYYERDLAGEDHDDGSHVFEEHDVLNLVQEVRTCTC